MATTSQVTAETAADSDSQAGTTRSMVKVVTTRFFAAKAGEVTRSSARRTEGKWERWLVKNGWKVVTSELGYVPKQCPELSDTQRVEVGEFLQTLDDHDDVHRVWAALK